MFYIKESEGVNFAKLSGDNNLIHIDKITGHNSIHGHNIVHGVLLILKFFKKIKFKQNYSSIKVQFQKGLKYNSEIKIRKIKKNKSRTIYQLTQNNEIGLNVEISLIPGKHTVRNLKKITFKKKYSISNKEKKRFNNIGLQKELKIALCYLSKYVGKVYPGKHSLLKEIKIFNNHQSRIDKIDISSFLLSKVFPLIDNRLFYKNYNIEFKTLIRPNLNIKLSKPNRRILKEVNSIKENILIIGASSGIGNDLLKLFLSNKKIKIIGTYYKNKIKQNKKNLIKKKLDIENDLKLVYEIIKKFNPIIIYYFATPKIHFKSIKNVNLIKKYKTYFIKIPIKIIKFANNFKSKFFYPSTTYNNKFSPYSLTKLKAEKEINKLKKRRTEINVLRIPGINTKQNLSLLNEKLPNFRDVMMERKEILNKVLFKN